VQAAVSRGLEALRCPEPLTLWEWADKHFYLSAESSSVEGEWRTLPYQRAIMGAMSNDDLTTITWQKCKRVGYTKVITAAVGYYSSFLRRSGVIYQPTESDAEDYVQDEIDPMLRDVPAVRDALLVDPERKSHHNKKDLKSFVGAILHIRGGKAARNYRRFTKDIVLFDEVDGFDLDIEGEGDPISLGDGRLETSSFPKSIRGSTPHLRGQSHIERAVGDADVVFHRHVRCQECGDLHRLTWDRMVYDAETPAEVRHACPECEHAAEYGELAAMDADGAWLDEDCHHTIDEYGVVTDTSTGDRVDVRHVAFRIWSAYSYFKPWADIVREFLSAERKATAGDIAAMKTWTNTVLGETWEETALEADHSALFQRREHYTRTTLPDQVLLLTAGVDVQEDRIEACAYGWGFGEESWHCDAIQLWGDPSQPDLWGELDEWMRLPRRTQSGQELNIRAMAVDSGHCTDQVYRYCRPRWRSGVFAVKGRGVEQHRPIIASPTSIRASDGRMVRLFTVGHYNATSLILRRLQIREPGPGFCHLPMTLDFEYCEQLASEKVVAKMQDGREVHRIVEIRKRNEALDMFRYGLAALYLVNPGRLSHRADMLTDAEVDPERKAAEEREAAAKQRAQRRRRTRSRFVTGY
jgi:phage terminase large subunit GpA-like protein